MASGELKSIETTLVGFILAILLDDGRKAYQLERF